VSDLSAFGAVSECLRRGLNVPQDIKIAGFGAFDIAEMSVPALTTIDAHSYEIGRQTGQLLVSVLRNNAPEKPASIIRIHPTLKITQSTAAT
jgi:LacI family gluconate utilization system Gnt-I transcriptional repressor